MFTKQRKIRGDRPIEPENDEEQKREAGPRVQTVRRLIERDRPGAGPLTLADYVVAGCDSLGSIAAASRRVRELGTRDWSAVPGGRSWDRIEDWMAATARSAAGPARGGVEGLIKATLTYWEMDESSAEYNQIRAKAEELMAQYASRRQPASRGGKEARAQFGHGLITYDVPVCAVLHVTDDSLGNPVAQGRSDWFSISDAESHARSASMAAPPPQRYLVYDENETLVSAWQSGQKMPMFVVAAKGTREADVTGEQWLDSQGIVGPERSQFVEYIRFNQWENEVCTEARWEKEYYGFIESKGAQAKRRASMSARARRMAAAAHRARQTVEQSPGEQTFDEFITTLAIPQERAEVFKVWMQRAPHWSVTLPSMPLEEWEAMWWLFKSGGGMASRRPVKVRQATQQMSSFGEEKKSLVTSFMRNELQHNAHDFTDSYTGEVNLTQLAEFAADRYDIYDPELPSDYDIPEWVFEVAFEVADSMGMIEAKRPAREQAALDIERGDLVDFGPYGQLYVVNPEHRVDWWWVTDDESQRFNRRAAGHSIKPYLAERIVQKWDDTMSPLDPEEYEGYYESVSDRPVAEGTRGPVEGEVIWLSGIGQEMTIQEIDWPNEEVVLAGVGGQQVVPVDSLRYFGSSGIDWMCDAEEGGTETEEGVRKYRIMAGDKELMATPARSVEQATEIAGETLAEGDRAAYIAWQDEGRVEEAGDPTLEEAFAWTGHLAAGAVTGRVDVVQTDPGLSALIETLDREVGEERLGEESPWILQQSSAGRADGKERL